MVSNPQAVAQSLKQLLARVEVTATHALVAVTDAAATFRVLELPAEATDQQVASAVAKELQLDPERFDSRWTDVKAGGGRRIVYAAAWERSALQSVLESLRMAGLEATVVELKSAAVARAVPEPSCIVIDLVAEPAEIFLVDGGVPRQWHSVDVAATEQQDLPEALAAPLSSVVRFHRRQPGAGLGAHSPILISAEQALPAQVLMRLSELVGQPVQVMGAPARVPADIRHPTYLTCLGLIMRRTA
jgi:hypothetical protein